MNERYWTLHKISVFLQLVGTKIPGGGIAISGQSQTQLGGGFQEGAQAPKGNNKFRKYI